MCNNNNHNKKVVRITADDGKKSECSDDNCKIEKKVIFFPHGKKVTCVWSEICNFIYSLGFEEAATEFCKKRKGHPLSGSP